MSKDKDVNPEAEEKEVDPVKVERALERINHMFKPHEGIALMNELAGVVRGLAEEGVIGE